MMPNNKYPFYLEVPKEIGRLSGATYLDLGYSQCIAAFNEKCLYFMEIGENLTLRYSTFPIQNTISLVSIVRGYILVETADKKLWLIEVRKEERTGEENTSATQIDKRE